MTSMFPPIPLTRAVSGSRFEAASRWINRELHKHGEATLCRGTGLGLMAWLLLFPNRFSPVARVIARAYVYRFWRPANPGEWLDLIAAFLLWPVAVIVCTVRYTRRNGATVAERFGYPKRRQIADQLKLCFTSGLLPPWYYIFELHRPGGVERARGYLTRGETKHGAYPLLANARGSSSPLGDKAKFSRFCAERQINALPVLLSVHDGAVRWANGGTALPQADLFVKPVRGRGGRGAERWDFDRENQTYRQGDEALHTTQLIERVRAMSRWQPFLVQERACNHRAISDLSNGALNTVRMISCLDEREQPELIGAVLRMAVGNNVTVDNVHAGGLAAAVDLAEGRLGPATDMGFDVRLGWIDRHPDTGGKITGRVLPMWDDLCDLVRRAHSAFSDWAVIGWDVAIMADGPRLVEGNSGPDVDLVQRPLRTPLADSRLGDLLAFHLDQSEQDWRV